VTGRRVAYLLTAVLAVYFVLLGRQGVLLIQAGGVAPVGLGIGVLILPLIGAWVVVATLRAGLRHQQLARRLHDEGGLPDTSGLPRRPSGRIDRDAADAYFAERKAEYEAASDDWRTSYRLAVAYDAAGDRRRARETMKRAVQLEEQERKRQDHVQP